MSDQKTNSKVVIANLTASEKFGDSELKGSICIDELETEAIKSLISEFKGKRYLHILVKKRKTASDKGKTHYIEINTRLSEFKKGAE